MTNDENDLDQAISALADALDNSPLVCLIPDNPAVIYGPFTPAQALEFCATWNEFFTEQGLPGQWVARNLLLPAS